MPHYRLYFLSRRSGSIERFEEFEAQDDDEAFALIEQRIGDQPLELWSGGRKIAQFESALALSGFGPARLWMHQTPPGRAHSSSRRMFSSWST